MVTSCVSASKALTLAACIIFFFFCNSSSSNRTAAPSTSPWNFFTSSKLDLYEPDTNTRAGQYLEKNENSQKHFKCTRKHVRYVHNVLK